MSNNSREARLERRIANLYNDDEQFAAAQPDSAVSEAAGQPDLRLPDVVRTIMEGYADRPALGQRAVEYVTDAGRTTAKLTPHFDTVTYGELWERVQAFSAALQGQPVDAGDRIAILGFTSVDYTVVDVATTQLGAVSVPLQTSAPHAQLQPIVAETEPAVVASSVDYLDDAV
jgi:fatty acid CoA ligase FadD9